MGVMRKGKRTIGEFECNIFIHHYINLNVTYWIDLLWIDGHVITTVGCTLNYLESKGLID